MGRSNPTVDAENEEPDEQASRVDNDDPEDPDMLVLGFQELDLSTEALIYSTSTAREEAWTLAIFASLGEKAVRYEKVCLSGLQLFELKLIAFDYFAACIETARRNVDHNDSQEVFEIVLWGHQDGEGMGDAGLRVSMDSWSSWGAQWEGCCGGA